MYYEYWIDKQKYFYVYSAYVSKHNSNSEKQVIPLISSNGKEWYYFVIKTLSALLTKYYNDFYCRNRLHSFRTKSKLELLKKVCESNFFCDVIMPSENTKILEFNQYQKSDKMQFIIYADLEYIIEKIDGCRNKSKN